jgi:hypothetical protein
MIQQLVKVDIQVLTKQNFLMYMASYYEESLSDDHCDFEDDLKRIKYIKRLLSKYKETGILRTRLIINHMIILMNTLGPLATTRILFHKIDPIHHIVVSTFLYKLDALTEHLKTEMNIDEGVCKMIDEEMR